MKRFIFMFMVFISGTIASVPGFANIFEFPECNSWMESTTRMTDRQRHFLCSRGNPRTVAQCVEGVIEKKFNLSNVGTLLLCDRGDWVRTRCFEALDGYSYTYVLSICNPNYNETVKAAEGIRVW